MDLVVGATGRVGQQVALGLVQRGRTIRALVRQGAHHPKAQPLFSAGIEICDADLTRPESLPAACGGIETIICTATSMPQGRNDGLRRVDLEGTLSLIAAAEAAGVRHFIYTSYSGNIREDCPLHTAKRMSEARLLDSSMRVTILRPSYFMETWLSPALGFDPANGTARIYGPGNAPVSYISVRDVVAYAVAATVSHGSGHQILEIGGPDGLSQRDAVAIFERTLKKRFKLDFIPFAVLEEQSRSPDPVPKTLAALSIAYAKGDFVPEAIPTAGRFGIDLLSVGAYAATFA
jgi:uncharacterized protein YbjT (DUF2867 family)